MSSESDVEGVFEYDQIEHKTLISGQNGGVSASDNGSRHDISTKNEVPVNLGKIVKI